MALSRRSKKCLDCGNLLDYYLDSPFPISCGKNGEEFGFSEDIAAAITERDFSGGVVEDLNCPNFDAGNNKFKDVSRETRE